MKKRLTLFLQMTIVLFGISALVFLLWEPHIEGRNAQTTLFQIYFNDPFLAYAYTSSMALFIILFESYTLLEYVKQHTLFSQNAIKAVRTIKYSAMALTAFILVPLLYLVIARPEDDIAGGVAMSLFLIIISVVITFAAKIFEGMLHHRLSLLSDSH